MEQRDANENPVSADRGKMERGQYVAVMSFTWKQSLLKAEGGALSREALAQLWRSFAERSLREQAPLLDEKVIEAGHHWMGNDLFITVIIPYGISDNPEFTLIGPAYQAAVNWETGFRGQLLQSRIVLSDDKLNVGVAAIETDSESSDEALWYEAAKRSMLHAQIDGGAERSLKGKSFHEMLSKQSIYPVYQPIMSMSSGGIFGFEALTRLPANQWFRGPMDIFKFADETGSAYSLDRLTRELAINGCLRLGPGQKLFINVMAQIMEDPRFTPGRTISLLEEHHLSPNQIVFEITERSSIEDFPSMKKALQHYRSQGYQIAIDDVGAGYSSLQSIVELRPDYLKVDRSIIQNIHNDNVKAHVLNTLQEVGGKIGAALIAEGIELKEELDKLREMGVPYAQGYLLGRPAPFPEQQ